MATPVLRQSRSTSPASATTLTAARLSSTVPKAALISSTPATSDAEVSKSVTSFERVSSMAANARRPTLGVPHAKTKRRKKVPLFTPLRQIDPNLPEEQQLKLVVELSLEHELKRTAKASADKGRAFAESMRRVLDNLEAHKDESAKIDEDANKYNLNPANKQLELRERQLKVVIASYEHELEEWKKAQMMAERDPISTAQPTEPHSPLKLDGIANVDEILESSTKAIEAYVLQTDQMRSMLTKIECQNRETKCRVRDIASKLNSRVLTEFGDSNDSQLIPPLGLTTVQTNDLNVSVLTSGPFS